MPLVVHGPRGGGRAQAGYVPRDSLARDGELLEWTGDHPHTNMRDLFLEYASEIHGIEADESTFEEADARKAFEVVFMTASSSGSIGT